MALEYKLKLQDSGKNNYSFSSSSYGSGVSSTGFSGYGGASSSSYSIGSSSPSRYATSSNNQDPRLTYKKDLMPSKEIEYASASASKAYNAQLAKTYDFFFNKGYGSGGGSKGSYISSILSK